MLKATWADVPNMSITERPLEPQPGRPLSNRAIAVSAVIVLGIGAIAWTVLLWRYGDAGPGVELDAIRTAGTLIVGAGGAAALLLAARRQQSTELTLEHQREVAAATERDTAEQRLTELYTHAVDQLGAEKAPVRLGGLHALERLAQNNPTQRQTIVDVICAYLRMPSDAHTRDEQRRQELQVRLTAQRILTTHLKSEAETAYWGDYIDLNLTEAHLHQFDLSACHVRKAQFDGAKFTGMAMFDTAEFAGDAMFDGADFTGSTYFSYVEFDGVAGFREARFTEDVMFRCTKFVTEALLDGVKFARAARFDGAEFVGITKFDGARVAPSRRFVLPPGWTTRTARPVEGEEEGWLYVVRDDESRRTATRSIKSGGSKPAGMIGQVSPAVATPGVNTAAAPASGIS